MRLLQGASLTLVQLWLYTVILLHCSRFIRKCPYTQVWQAKESRYLNNQSKFISKYRKHQHRTDYKWRPLSERDAVSNRPGQPESGQDLTTRGLLSHTISSQHDTYASDPRNAFVVVFTSQMECNGIWRLVFGVYFLCGWDFAHACRRLEVDRLSVGAHVRST